MRLFDLLLVVLLFVMGVSMIGLFAMMGELAARVGSQDRHSTLTDTRLTPIESVQLGVRPVWWPAEIGHIPAQRHAAVLVLSNVCQSCLHIAEEPADSDLRRAPWIGIAISCGSMEAGKEFIEQTGLGEDRLYLDELGDWTQANFAVTVSPALLQFESGSLIAADTLVSVIALESIRHDKAAGVLNED